VGDDTAGVDDEPDDALELGGMTLLDEEEVELGVGVGVELGVVVGVSTSVEVKVLVEVLRVSVRVLVFVRVSVRVLVSVFVTEMVDPGRVMTPPGPVQVLPIGQQPRPSQ
jgi:hypothetical protein